MARLPINRVIPLPLKDWPVKDRQAWQIAIAPGDILDEGGQLASKPLSTRLRIATEYGRWLAFLSIDAPATTINSGCDYLIVERLRDYIEHRAKGLAPYSVVALLKRLHAAAKALGPKQSWPALVKIVGRYSQTARPSIDKRARLRPIHELYDFGFALMAAATSIGSSIPRASKYLDGLAITMLAACPVRIGNLGAMRLGQHIIKNADCYEISFAGHEVKNGHPIEFVLPTDLTEPIDHYLGEVRPRLLKGRGRWKRSDEDGFFWISSHGAPLSAKHLSVRIVRRTKLALGVGINPHVFRAAAATAIAIHDPEHVGAIKSVLGHTSMRTGERYYNLAASIDASRHYLEVIDGLRSEDRRS